MTVTVTVNATDRSRGRLRWRGLLAAAQREYDAPAPHYDKVIELLDQVVGAAVPVAALRSAKALQALALTQLAYAAEYGPLRSVYLAAARELATGPLSAPRASAEPSGPPAHRSCCPPR
ncbi:alkyl sulfatase dimerization domain-containing protein [Streptomyces sp. NPDC048416]|uniref:alkyl sulfatase dimerization domain-containing protein n=1 Tax=Streptomyces sp. NPDC048416 TaxID=3365546 RepID=UPI00371459BC